MRPPAKPGSSASGRTDALPPQERSRGEGSIEPDGSATAALVTESAALPTLGSGDMLSHATPDARYVWVSPASERVVGWTPEELVGRNGHGLVHPEDLALVAEALAAVLAQSYARVTKYRFLHKDGHYRWVESNARALRDERGDVLHVQVITRDVASRPHVDEQLRRSETLHRTLTANLPDTSMFLIDRDLRVLVAEGEGVRQLPWIDENMFRGRLVTELHGELPSEVLADVAGPATGLRSTASAASSSSPATG